jgi:type II restriction/modification system DNA methylase subunit YeeA
MDTQKLKRFAQEARNTLMAQVAAKLDLAVSEGSAARREFPAAVRELEREIAESTRLQVVEKVAYTWFNRFSALRFMDANGYTNPRIVTPADGQTRPEILAEAAAGHSNLPGVTALLDGRTPSRDAQGEAYRLLLVVACNEWHAAMPFLFEKIADYTELLLPDDLLSPASILSALRAAMTDADCTDVEVIGWLYQFYISEKKDQVFAGLKKNVKITAENIPAATQLFTPHWIVRYLVENSLGRLWMLNRPGSSLRTRLDYYIAPEEAETDFLRVTRPEEIKLCDPACGSGHMLTYAFDLLYAIYEEEGYDPATIPDLILTHNLYGVEIDDRAGALAAFALVMKAAGRRRRFLRAPVQPNICVMQDVSFTTSELADYTTAVGRDLFTSDLRETLGQFDQAKNFGALIVPKLRDVAEVARRVAALDFESNLFLRDVHLRVMQVLRMAEALSPKYHVVVANPPYMGGGGMNSTLGSFAKSRYPDSKADLFAMFMERNIAMLQVRGMMAMINMQAWMFLGSFEKMRIKILSDASIVSMAHLGERGFDSIGGAVVSTTAFVFEKSSTNHRNAVFVRLVEGRSEAEKSDMLRKAIVDHNCGWLYKASGEDFRRTPGSPISYWLNQAVYKAFENGKPLYKFSKGSTGLQTSDSGRFVRLCFEVEAGKVGNRWFRFAKGGGFRRWYGNVEHMVNWEAGGVEIKEYVADKYPYLNGNYALVVKNEGTYFSKGLLASRVTTGALSFREKDSADIYADACTAIFPDDCEYFLALLNSRLLEIIRSLNPTMNFQASDIEKFPVLSLDDHRLKINSRVAVQSAKSDWDAYETSWDFSKLPLLDPAHRQASLAATYATLRQHWQGMTTQMQALEEQNNRIFIDAYGLAEELTPEVPLEEITLTCNPAYRYGGKKTVAELEALLQADTLREFLHYAVGCMFGRYSLDAPGLILANQGDGLAEYMAKVPEPKFAPDADNVIPMLDEDWFPDDVTERFRRFLRVTFGELGFQDNLAFIEGALGKDIRKYFTRDFFNDHVKRYKKRPIYWLFSSPKGSFNALIYMHRYRPDQVSILLNDYVRAFITKLQAYCSQQERQADNSGASQSERIKAGNEVSRVGRMLDELTEWEREMVFPLAQAKIEIDLDDGVKANYPKFAGALKAIKGLEVSEDD